MLSVLVTGAPLELDELDELELDELEVLELEVLELDELEVLELELELEVLALELELELDELELELELDELELDELELELDELELPEPSGSEPPPQALSRDPRVSAVRRILADVMGAAFFVMGYTGQAGVPGAG
jgi:hypothetical protein